VDLSLGAQASGNTLEFVASNPDGALTLDAKLFLETGNPDQLIWPAGCQALSPTSAVCYVDARSCQHDGIVTYRQYSDDIIGRQ